MRYRLLIEVRWLRYCTEHKELGAPQFNKTELAQLEDLYTQFDAQAYERIKDIEKDCQHDVKAVELYIREQLANIVSKESDALKLEGARAWTHFACTSEDINNLAWALMLKAARDEALLPEYRALKKALGALIDQTADSSMLARTHGQPASPTTMGKELAVFVWRIERQYALLEQQALLGKFNGAVGNYNAHHVAYPKLDWLRISKEFVSSLGLEWAPISTQVDARDWMSEYFDALSRLNIALLDLCRDVWGYISLGYFQQISAGSQEVGSSTMPHKINPIDFENAEGNIGIANSLLRHLSEKLPVSRWQRDLSDSTAMRNIGVALGHSLLASKSIIRGLSKLQPDKKLMESELAQNWSVLAEAIQTVMRKNGMSDAYDRLKELTRGRTIDANTLHDFIDALALPETDKKQLREMTPADYIGLATELSKRTRDKVNKRK